jgi:hypothetical protein
MKAAERANLFRDVTPVVTATGKRGYNRRLGMKRCRER